MHPLIQKINKEQKKDADKVPGFAIGDSVKVHKLIKEGDRQRIQVFSGTVIAIDGTGATETFTVRRVTQGEGVEKVFPIHSPHVEKVEVVRSGKVRRAKLYYLRGRSGKKARLTEKHS